MIPTSVNGDQAPDLGADFAFRHPIPFKIHGEIFHGVPDLPAGMLFDMASMFSDVKGGSGIGTQFETLDRFFQLLLVPESYERFKERMRDPERPITIGIMMAVMRYLIEQMTGRPTEQSSSSSAGQ